MAKCKKCGACSECGATPPVPYPYVVYYVQRPPTYYSSPYITTWSTNQCGVSASSGTYNNNPIGSN